MRQVKMPCPAFCLHGIVAEIQEHGGRILQRTDIEGTIRLEASMVEVLLQRKNTG